MGWAILVVASGALLMTVQVLIGGMALPAACTGRGSLICEAMNLLHAVGGRMLAALPVALITGFLVRLGVRLIRKPRW